MLEKRWRETVRNHGPRTALTEASTGRSWTFSALAEAADAGEPEVVSGRVHPQGRDVSFVLEVLRAWRTGLPMCPLEPGQSRPDLQPVPGDVSLLKLTSGSTGAPKGVALDAAQVAADADQIVATMGLRPDWPNLGVISLAHSYGFSNLVTPLLLHGIPLILLETPLPRALAAAAEGHDGLTLAAVPALWRTWHEAGSIPGNLRIALSAGAPLPLPLEEAVFRDHGLKIHNFLGASECGGIAYDRTDRPRSDASVVGTAMHGVGLSVDDDGLLVVRSPAVARGYFPASDDSLHGGTFRTSDLATLGADGVLRLRGRAGDLVNVAGRKVRPEAVEQAVLQHPAVADALAFGVPDPSGRGEAVGLVVCPRGPLDESALRAFLAARLQPWELPRRWWFRDSLAVDGRGKRSRTAWRQALLQ